MLGGRIDIDVVHAHSGAADYPQFARVRQQGFIDVYRRAYNQRIRLRQLLGQFAADFVGRDYRPAGMLFQQFNCGESDLLGNNDLHENLEQEFWIWEFGFGLSCPIRNRLWTIALPRLTSEISNSTLQPSIIFSSAWRCRLHHSLDLTEPGKMRFSGCEPARSEPRVRRLFVSRTDTEFDTCARACKNKAAFGPKWRNWQTRMVQVHVSARTWGFESLLRHQKFRGFADFRQSLFCLNFHSIATQAAANTEPQTA